MYIITLIFNNYNDYIEECASSWGMHTKIFRVKVMQWLQLTLKQFGKKLYRQIGEREKEREREREGDTVNGTKCEKLGYLDKRHLGVLAVLQLFCKFEIVSLKSF